MTTVKAVLALLLILFMPQEGWAAKNRVRRVKTKVAVMPQPESLPAGLDYFKPAKLLEGIGLGRSTMTDQVLQLRTERVIQSATFSIMCDYRAVEGAQRILSPELQKLFAAASRESGFPQELLEALAMVESWGVADARSPSGALGIMQMISTTAERLGLVVPRRVLSKKFSRKRSSPAVLTADERLSAEKSIMAAAKYLARLTKYYGRTDLAIWAYHSGEGYPNKALELGKKYGITKPSMAKLFFLNSPAYNSNLYELIQKDMRHDFGSTYYFVVKRSAELLALYRSDPVAYKALARKYANPLHPNQRTPNRLWFWYGSAPMFKTSDDLKREQGKSLVLVPHSPAGLSFSLRSEEIGRKDPKNRELYLQDTPEAIGGFEYISFEVRRLWEASHPKNEKFVPIEAVGLIQSVFYRSLLKEAVTRHTELPVHCIGGVDVSYQKLPPWETKCLEFVVEDLGWDEYISYFLESKSKKTLHFGTSPHHAGYFAGVHAQAQNYLASR